MDACELSEFITPCERTPGAPERASLVRTCSYNRPRRGAPHYTPERRSRWGRARVKRVI
jgi:hypothetical protein